MDQTQIRFITPFSFERNKLGYPNIGKSYNQAIKELPNDCYVVLRDQDTMFLTPDASDLIKSIIEKNGQNYDLITCMTNRVGLKTHTCGDFLFNCKDVSEHIYHALTRLIGFGSEVRPIDIAPGYFMLFHKSLWTKVGGFPEYDITFDRVFSDKVLKSGGKIGIATGLYIFHNYRMLSENPQSDIKHLRKRIKG